MAGSTFEGTLAAEDPEGGALTFEQAVGPRIGSLTLAADGRFSYSLPEQATGADVFTVRVSDPAGATATLTVSVTISPGEVVRRGGTLTIDFGVVGQRFTAPVRYEVVSAPRQGTVEISNSGSVIYGASADAEGPEEFAVLATGAEGRSARLLAAWTFARPNRPPVPALPEEIAAQPGETSTGRFEANDPDGDRLRFSLVEATGPVSLNVLPGGDYSLALSSAAGPVEEAIIAVSDGVNPPVQGAIRIVSNRRPVVEDQRFELLTGLTLRFPVPGRDPEGETLRVRVAEAAALGPVTIAGDQVIYDPRAGLSGEDQFVLALTDPGGAEARATITVVVRPPEIEKDPDGRYAVQIGAYGSQPQAEQRFAQASRRHPELAPLDFTAETVSLDGRDMVRVVAGPLSERGARDLCALMTGRNDQCVVRDLPNRPPRSGNFEITLQPGATMTGGIEAGDPDGDPLTFTEKQAPSSLYLTLEDTGRFTLIAPRSFSGRDSFSATISDGRGGTFDVTVSVVAGNRPPVASPLSFETGAGVRRVVQVDAADPEGEPLSLAVTTTPNAGGRASVSGLSLTYTPAPGFSGVERLTLTATDPAGAAVEIPVSVTVNPNTPPEVADLHLETATREAVAGRLRARDAEGDRLSFAIGLQPDLGRAAVDANGTVGYRSRPGVDGTDSFTVEVDDGRGGRSVATVTVAVTNANQPPVLIPLQLLGTAGQDVTGQLQASDPDGDSVTVRLRTSPQSGEAEVRVDGTIRYRPYQGFAGRDTFQVEALDGRGGRDAAMVTVLVRQPPPAPTPAPPSTPTPTVVPTVAPTVAPTAVPTVAAPALTPTDFVGQSPLGFDAAIRMFNVSDDFSTVTGESVPASGFIFIELETTLQGTLPGLTFLSGPDGRLAQPRSFTLEAGAARIMSLAPGSAAGHICVALFPSGFALDPVQITAGESAASLLGKLEPQVATDVSGRLAIHCRAFRQE